MECEGGGRTEDGGRGKEEGGGGGGKSGEGEGRRDGFTKKNALEKLSQPKEYHSPATA